jgi:hypothetical protein
MLFPGPLPEPVQLEDLNARLMLLTGYVQALLGTDAGRSDFQRSQDRLAAAALHWCVPYVRALIDLAVRHPEEFRDLCPKPTRGELLTEPCDGTEACQCPRCWGLTEESLP